MPPHRAHGLRAGAIPAVGLATAALVVLGQLGTAATAAGAAAAAAAPHAHAAPTAAAVAPTAAAGRTIVLELASTGDGQPAIAVPASAVSGRTGRAALGGRFRPDGSQLFAAAAQARAAGLTVTAATPWSITATGSATTVDALVGSDPEAAVVPTGWAGTTSHVLDATAGAGVWKAHGAQSLGELEQAYGGGVPDASTPVPTSSTPVVASIQLAGWNPLTLKYFAPQVFTDGSYDPLDSGQFTAVNAGGDDRALSEGSGEVSLDQEALLGAAPQLRQRAYFADNGDVGYVTALQSILDDVIAGQPIVAVTTSWGSCEGADSSAALNAMDSLIHKLSDLGVTVLAASGDSGAFDCADSGRPVTGVDYPASDPFVVGVGGTSHANGSATPAPDTAWSDSGQEAGTGGGVSSIWARPAYQATMCANAGRAVPDLAADADPETGVTMVLDVGDGRGPQDVTVGGTSLSAPLVASLLGDAAAARTAAGGITGGFGDIHATLYAHPEAFTDVVATTGGDSGVTATPAPGYDEATGLGTPRFDVLAPLLAHPGPFSSPTPCPAPPAPPGGPLLTTAPPALNTAPVAHVTSWSRPDFRSARATATWSVSGGTAPVTGFTLTVTSGGRTVAHTVVPPATRSASFTLPAGQATLTVAAASAAGLSSAGARLSVPTDDRAVARGWGRTRDRGAYLGTLSTSAIAGQRAGLSGTAATFRVTWRAGAAGGLARLYLDGRPVAVIDTFASHTRENVSLLIRAAGGRRHTVTLVVLGRHDARSRGSTVALDAITAG